MKKQILIFILISLLIISLGFTFYLVLKVKDNQEIKNITGTILEIQDNNITIQDNNKFIYIFKLLNLEKNNLKVGDNISINYAGILNKKKKKQNVKVIDFENLTITNKKDLFENFYTLAANKVQKMSLDEKISQMLLVRYPDAKGVEILKEYQFGGYLFFAKDFKNKTETDVKKMLNELQKVSKIPILTAVDEEGGTVVRVSSNANLVPEKFKSPQILYNKGGFEAIKNDTINKSKVLINLGLNLNLAPVVDVSIDPNDYMYQRTIGKDTNITSTYAKTVIKASKNLGVSYTLKHFPGYGNNLNTHFGTAFDERSFEDIEKNDLPPFKAGIEVGAEAILVSHNIVTSIDKYNPASLSLNIHKLLRQELNFTGIIMTDDLSMGATINIPNASVKAIQAGNDLIITTNYKNDFKVIKEAIQNKTVDEDLINKATTRIIAWKYYKGLINV